MKPFTAIIFCFLVLGVDSQRWFQFMKETGQESLTIQLSQLVSENSLLSSAEGVLRTAQADIDPGHSMDEGQNCTQSAWRAVAPIACAEESCGCSGDCSMWEGVETCGELNADMREANWKKSDKYLHARGNYDAAQRGPGGAWAAKVMSDAREGFKRITGRGIEDSRADQFANEWGRSGKDHNFFRLPGLPSKY